MRVGILGGAFNPPHVGHLVCAQEAYAQLDLEFVELMPTGHPAHREIEADPGPETRARLCELVVAQDDRLRLGRLELERPGPSYTSDTLRTIRERHPGDELFVILGADQATRLPSWHEPDVVLDLATVAVAARAGVERDQVLSACEGLEKAGEIVFFEMPRLDLSSSEIRERAGSGRPVRYLVPDTVAELIEAENLYGASRAVTSQ